MSHDTGPAGAGPVRPADLTERVVGSKTIYKGSYLTFRIDTVERTDGSRAEREVVGHPGAVAILAIDDHERVLMVRQYRVPAGRILLEIPAGTLDIDPDSGAIEDPDLAAPRELEEETGYTAKTWRALGKVAPNPAIQNNTLHTYLALDAEHTTTRRPDDGEVLAVETMSLAGVQAMMREGRIEHALVVVAFGHLALELGVLRRP